MTCVREFTLSLREHNVLLQAAGQRPCSSVNYVFFITLPLRRYCKRRFLMSLEEFSGYRSLSLRREDKYYESRCLRSVSTWDDRSYLSASWIFFGKLKDDLVE